MASPPARGAVPVGSDYRTAGRGEGRSPLATPATLGTVATGSWPTTPRETPTRIELLWFDGCPHHKRAEALLREAMGACGVAGEVVRIEVADETIGRAVCFPGSPTIRIDGHDVDPENDPCTCTDCAPRCRLYATASGLTGLPEREWIRAALCAAA